ncbi:TPA: hypothetical protein DCX15_01675, partial [bacterium]|nr:hypothetical protein [bacterium]
MREKLTIRCGRKQFKKLNNEFFNSAWIKEKHDFGVDEIYVISNYLDDKAYSIYIDSLKELCKIDSVGLYSCAYIDRVYTKREIENTKLFLFKFSPSAMFEPAGEEVGTCYDESKACPQCKAGRV